MHSRLLSSAPATGQIKRLCTLTVLLLGFAVFFWGLHDKLSLYAPPSAPHPIARAKLLSQAEQPSTQAAAMPQAPRTVPPLLLAFFCVLLSLLFSVEPEMLDCFPRGIRPKSPPLLAATRLRPPPVARGCMRFSVANLPLAA
jgi:hypothetical protein